VLAMPARVPRLAIAVTPRLLQESLARVLADGDVDVVIVPEDRALAHQVLEGKNDIIVTSEPLPPSVAAPLVLRVGDATTTGTDRTVDIVRLEDIFERIDAWRAQSTDGWAADAG